jgi:hypothetical protein
MYSTSRRVYTVETGEMKSDLMFHVIFGFVRWVRVLLCWSTSSADFPVENDAIAPGRRSVTLAVELSSFLPVLQGVVLFRV